MYFSNLTDICIRKDRLHSIEGNNNFFSIFLFRNSRTQSYHSLAIGRNTKKSEISKYNTIISLPILSEILMCIFLSPAVSLGHFDPNAQADIWLKQKQQELKTCKAKARSSQWAVGDENEWGAQGCCEWVRWFITDTQGCWERMRCPGLLWVDY